MYLRFLLLLLAWLCVTVQPMAQTRKRVGLVLSGGGAKGIAHIGVLKVLEEHGIPIDYITAASMGSVMGGMYSAGYTAQQLDSIVRLPQFQRWVLGELPPGEEYLFGKREQGAEWFNFQVRVDSNYQVETGSQLVKDTSLNFALMKFLYRAGAKANYDFDSLPIPFRATASDVLMRQSVALRRGDLFESVRASMAVPLVYRPMLIDGKYLYDGGVYDNLPIDVMRRDFNPDVLLVVNLGKDDLIKEYPYTKAKTMLQGTGVLRYLIMDSKAPSGLSAPDVVYLQVPVNDFSSADFRPVDTLVHIGEQTARKQLQEIKAKVGALVAPGREDRLQELYEPTVREIIEIDFEGALTNHQRRYLRNILKPADGPVSIDELLERYNLLISQDYFRDVFCKLIYDPERKGYRLLLSSNPNKQVVGSVGGNFSSRAISQLYLGVNFNLLSSFLFSVNGNLYTGPFYTSPHLNLRMLFPGRHLDFFSMGYTFNRWDYSKVQELLANTDEGGVQVYRTDRQVIGRLGRYVGRRSVLSVFMGGWWERLTYNRSFDLNVDSAQVQAVIDAKDYLNTWVVGAAYTKATLNTVQFPTSGMRLHASVKYLLGNEHLDISEQGAFLDRHHHLLMAKVSWEQYWGQKWVGGVMLEGVASNIGNFLTYTTNFMYAPAYYPLIDSRTVVTPTFRSPMYTAFTGILDRQVFLPSLRLRLQGSGFVRYQSLHPPYQGIVLGDRYRTDVQMDWAASLSAIYHSPLGPVSFSALRYSDKQLGWSVLLNVGLMLYNPRIIEE